MTPCACTTASSSAAQEIKARPARPGSGLWQPGRAGASGPIPILTSPRHFGGRAPNSFDVLLLPGVDLLILDDPPLELAGRAAVGGRLLSDDDPVARVRREATTRKIYFDELPRITRAHREFAAAVTARAGEFMVDEDRVLRLLRSTTDDISVLMSESEPGEDHREDPIWIRGAKYTFVKAIEASVDAAKHICATEGWGPPPDNGDAVRLLGDRGVCAPELARSIRQPVGFRNVPVHDYIRVNDGIVIDRLKSPGDLEEFATQVAAFVTAA